MKLAMNAQENKQTDYTPTKEQQQIYTSARFGGSALINAVAGAGKTSTLIKCSEIIASESPCRSILFCAFNTSIKDEIRKKTKDIKIDVYTVHGLGFRLLREHKLVSSIEPEENNPQIKGLDDNKYEKLLKDALVWKEIEPYAEGLEDKNSNGEKPTYKEFCADLVRICDKYRMTLPDDNLEAFSKMLKHYQSTLTYKEDAIERYYNATKILLSQGEKILLEKHIYDFTDMLYLPIRLGLTPKFRYSTIFIDECQDLSHAQIEIIKKFRQVYCQIIAVGDPFQSIYGFNGADDNSFEHVCDEFSLQDRRFPLSNTFRCPQSVVQHVKDNFDIKFDGRKKELGKCMGITREDAVCLAKAGELVLARYRRTLINFAFELIKQKKTFYIRKEDADKMIKELQSPFKDKKQLNQQLTWCELRRMLESVNAKSDETTAKETRKALDLIMDLVNDDWKVSSIAELINKIKSFIYENDKDTSKAIILSTIHTAKGLENNTAYLLNYEYLGEANDKLQPWENKQEQNLKYVAITRAKKALFMVSSTALPLGDDILSEELDDISGQEWYQLELDTIEWKELRERIKQRDNYTCQCCGRSTTEAINIPTYRLKFHSGLECDVRITIEEDTMYDKYYQYREERIKVDDWSFIKLSNYPTVVYISPALHAYPTPWTTIEEAESHFKNQRGLYNFYFEDARAWAIGNKGAIFSKLELPLLSIDYQIPRNAHPDTCLHVHHKYYINGHSPYQYKDNELITLCGRCHEEIHSEKVNVPSFRRRFYGLNLVSRNLIKFTPCDVCKGTGHVSYLPSDDLDICPKCNGARYIELSPFYNEQMMDNDNLISGFKVEGMLPY